MLDLKKAVWDGEYLFVDKLIYQALSDPNTMEQTAASTEVVCLPKYDPLKEELLMTQQFPLRYGELNRIIAKEKS